MLARSASIRAFTRRDGVRLVAIGLLIVLVLGAVLAVDALPGPFPGSSQIVDNVATADIRAPRAVTYTSQAATDQRREEARLQVRAAVRLHAGARPVDGRATAQRVRHDRRAGRRCIRRGPVRCGSSGCPAGRHPAPDHKRRRYPGQPRPGRMAGAARGDDAGPRLDATPGGARHPSARRSRLACQPHQPAFRARPARACRRDPLAADRRQLDLRRDGHRARAGRGR